jgi:hypothetical protein
VIVDLRVNAKKMTDEEWEAAISQTFKTILCNGQEVELIPDGANTLVTKQNLE